MRDTLQFLRNVNKKSSNLVTDNELRDYKSCYKKALSESKRKANDHYIKNCSNSQSAMWDVIKSNNPVLNLPKTANISVNQFNNFFVNIAENIVNALPKIDVNPIDFIKTNATNSALGNFKFKEVSFNQVRTIVNNLKNTKSKDPYDITVKIIKSIKYYHWTSH